MSKLDIYKGIYTEAKGLLIDDPKLTLNALCFLIMGNLDNKEDYQQAAVKQAWRERQTIIKSEEWLRDFCAVNLDISYETLLKSVDNIQSDNNYLIILGEDAYGSIPSEIWPHLEIILDKKFKNVPTQFSCSC